MNRFIKLLTVPVAVGLASVMPFVVMEVVNQPVNFASFPYPLFMLMWLLSTGFVMLLIMVARQLTRGSQSAILLVARVTAMILISLFWIGLVTDQMPCFLGIPNCD